MGTRILLDSDSMQTTARVLADAADVFDEIAAVLSSAAAAVGEIEPIVDSAAFTLRRIAIEISIDGGDLGRRAGCCCEPAAGGMGLPALASSAVGSAAWGGAVAATGGTASSAASGGAAQDTATPSWLDSMDSPAPGAAVAPTPTTASWGGQMDAANQGYGDGWNANGTLAAWKAEDAAGVGMSSGTIRLAGTNPGPGTTGLNNAPMNRALEGMGVPARHPGSFAPDYAPSTLIQVLSSESQLAVHPGVVSAIPAALP